MKRAIPAKGSPQDETGASLRWRVLKSTYEIDSPFLRVRKENVELPSGQIVEDFYSIDGTQIVAVLAVNTINESVLVVRQYRHPIGEVTVDLPGGAVGPNEEPSSAAHRELLEETGYKAKSLRRLFSYYPDSGRKGDIKHVFLAGRLEPSIPQRTSSVEEGENTEPVWIPLKTLFQQMGSGSIQEGTLLTSIFFYKCFAGARPEITSSGRLEESHDPIDLYASKPPGELLL